MLVSKRDTLQGQFCKGPDSPAAFGTNCWCRGEKPRKAVELSDLAKRKKKVGYPVKFEFQINNE